MSPRGFKAVAAFLTLTFFLSLAGQEKSQQPREETPYKLTVRSNMVLVPVVVTDKHGQHVSGLTTADFKLREDGQEKELAACEEVKAETNAVPRVAVAPNSFTNQIAADHPKKLEIVLFDLLNTPLSARVEARRGLTAFLAKSVDSDTLVALLVLSSSGVRMVHNFTGDPAVLAAAVHKVQSPAAARDAPTMNTNGGDVDAEAGQISAILAGTAAIANSNPTPGTMRTANRGMEALGDVSKQNQDAVLTMRALQQIAQYFAGVPGRKSLIWASTGFNFDAEDAPGGATRGPAADYWQRTVRMLQDANIAMYPVDVGGMEMHSNIDVHTEIPGAAETAGFGDVTVSTGGKHQTMKTLADLTGGQAYYGLNDSDALFVRASQDSAQYYLLSYYTKDTGKNGWRKLQVRVLRDGVEVRARTGFYFDKAGRDPDSARKAEEVMAVTSALDSTSVPLYGQWKQMEPAGSQSKAHFLLVIPPGAVTVDTDHENHLNLDFVIFAWNTEGKKAAEIEQRIERKLTPVELGEIQTHGMSYDNFLALAPGEYDVHMVVRDNLSGRIGSVVTQLKVQ